MAKLGINTGSTPNDGTGDTLLAAALKINQNFDEIYTTFGDGASLSGIVGYATEGYVDNAVVGFITSGALSGYATEGYVDNAVVGFITSGALSGYATEGYVDNAIVGYATEGYVDNAIVGFITSGSLTGYATEGYVNSKVGLSTVGLLSATGNGSTLTGIVTSITAGSGILVNQSTGSVTISATGGGGGGGESYWVSTAAGIHTFSNVGVGTTNPRTPLQIENVYGIDTGSGTFSPTPGVSYAATSWTISSTNFRTAEYTLWFQHTGGIQSQKILIMNDGINAYYEEYGIMYSNSPLVSVGATVESGSVKLLWTPESGVTGVVTYRFTRETML